MRTKLATLALLACACATPGELDELRVEEDERVLARQAKELESRAADGDVDAMIALADRLFEGRGVERDRARSVLLLQRAGDAGSVDAQYSLGVMYELGMGVVQEEPEAAAWYAAASRSGHARAQHNLALMKLEARGVPKDDAGAFELLSRAATAGVARSQYLVGQLHLTGRGTPRDDTAAVQWFEAAAAQGELRATAQLGSLLARGTEDVPQDLVRAARLLERAANGGVVEAQRNVALLYVRRDDEGDRVRALTWNGIAMRLGDAIAAERFDRLSGLATPDERERAERDADRWFEERRVQRIE